MYQMSDWVSLVERHSRTFKFIAAPVILLMIIGVYFLVYYTGGIKYVYSHSMYIPIILAGFVFGPRGGIIAGLLGGIALGHFMPINVATGESQELANWLYRMFFFITIGLITGAMVSVLRSYIQHVEWLAHHDYNTRLPNRLSLIKALDISRTSDDSNFHSLLVIAIENLHKIIAGFGLESADTLVSKVVGLLSKRYPDNVRFFHHHPEHIAVLTDLTSREKVTELAHDILEVMNDPYEYENVPLHLDVRIGCINIGKSARSATSLIGRAEYALNEARELAYNYHIYDDKIDNNSTESLALMGALRKAMEENQLQLHYQPIVDIGTRQIIGAEALLRWNHPQKGMVPPGMFISHAESSSLIQPLTCWVLDTSLKQLAEWRDEGLDLQIAVNISTRNLLQTNFNSMLVKMLNRHGIPPHALELEVTETSLMYNPEEALKMLNSIADSGISIAIDDFGTGYSSLQYLNTISASAIKIDQTFIKDMNVSESARHIVESAITLGHSLDCKIVSEGIETADNYTMLVDIGCDYGQGYYIAKPMPERQFTNWLRQSGMI